jgi:hypothetical protein
VTENFELYLMWKPSSPNSIPVPLEVIAWNWIAVATNVGGNWNVTTWDIPKAPGITGKATTAFPEWTQKVNIAINTVPNK